MRDLFDPLPEPDRPAYVWMGEKKRRQRRDALTPEVRRERRLLSLRKYRESGKERESRRRWKERNPEWVRVYSRERERLRREQIMLHYKTLLGGRCAVCGIDDFDVLSFDHIHGDGHNVRRRRRELLKPNRSTYSELVELDRAGVLSEKLQLLCANDHMKKTRAEAKRRRMERPPGFSGKIIAAPKVLVGAANAEWQAARRASPKIATPFQIVGIAMRYSSGWLVRGVLLAVAQNKYTALVK